MNYDKEIIVRPTAIYALLKIIPLALTALAFVFFAWSLAPLFILPGIVIAAIAVYRYVLTRNTSFTIEPEFIRIRRGLVFKRTDQVEMYRIKDYVIMRPLSHQIFRIMNLTLKTIDPENPVIKIFGVTESDLVDLIRERVQEARKVNKVVELS